MSDTEKEPFDKEAEKEKLRQQLADEEEDRKTTQHMSELLLKGATMTNRHCESCGDPLFRHEGREFCPTCGWEPGAAVDAGGAPTGTGEQGAATDAGDGDEATANGGTASGSAGGEDGPAAGPSPATVPSRGSPATGASAGPAGSGAGATATGEADLPAAREALARRVTALAREAEATRDVGRTRELLAAVREGAEALRALDGVGR